MSVSMPGLRRLAARASGSPGAAVGPRAGIAPGQSLAGGPAVAGGETTGGASERCELCAEPAPPEHRHLLEVSERRLCCVCRACSVLFDNPAAGGGRYLMIPNQRWLLRDFHLDDAAWAGLRIPVDMAFFFHDSAAGQQVAFYPSPAGAVQSLLPLATWQQIESANPVLGGLAADVEALLVNRARGAAEHFVTPVDDCYSLVGLIRRSWKGLSGGEQVWDEINQFFHQLRRSATQVAASQNVSGVPGAVEQ
ncbi:MAG: DUF5947 family protein [Micromonosporaceae bacterium]